MAYFLEENETGFHTGEEKIRNLLHVPPSENPTVPYLHPSTGAFLSRCTLLILGSLDPQHRPWTSIVAGPPGFVRGLNTEHLAISGNVAVGDPILDNLVPSGEMMVSGLGVDLAMRRRAKLFGRVSDGMRRVVKNDGALQAVLNIEQTLGNCPKYITTRKITFVPTAIAPTQQETRNTIPQNSLSQSALALIQTADIFFITTRNGEKDMDTNLRGGPSGFVRLLPSSADALTTIIWPEYSGNRLYQTLGNLAVTPEAGLTFADFIAGNVLYLTGTTEIITLETGLQHILPRSNLAIKFTIQESKFLEAALPIRESSSDAEKREFSPYNPPVRYLSSEKTQPPPFKSKENSLRTRLLGITPLTSNVAVFKFSLLKSHDIRWKAGQYIALGFGDEIGTAGYRHMNDSDPQSLNDDYIRTFTVISTPKDNDTVEILIRRVGTVTNWLFSLIGNKRKLDLGIEIPVRGFGGEFGLVRDEQEQVNFVAGGVGITPLLSFLGDKGWSDVNVWWSIRKDDIGIVREILKRHPGLARGLKVFITGGKGHNLEGLESIRVFWRRIDKRDLVSSENGGKAKWYLCASSELRKKIVNWLGEEGQEVHWEDFGY